MTKNKNLIILGVITTYILGIYGFYLSYSKSIFDCLYATTLLFFMNLLVSAEQINIFINIARWIALLISANIVFTVLQAVLVKFKASKCLKDKKLIVLHGDNVNKLDDFFQHSVIFNEPVLWQAKKHLFSFNDEKEMFDYISKNSQYISDEQQLYLLTSGMSQNDYSKDNVLICNLAEVCARFYWKKYPIETPDEKVVLIGFGHYGEELFNYAYQLNVIHPQSHIEYHIFADGNSYLYKHPNLGKGISINEPSQKQDCLFFHEEDWLSRRKLLESADRIILIADNDEDNLETLNILKKNFSVKRVDIRYMYSELVRDIWGNDVSVFGTDEELLQENIILDEETFEIAKTIHCQYYKNYVCPSKCEKNCLQCTDFLKDWNSLTPFLRYSNVTQADHVFYKKRILENMMEDKNMSIDDFYHSLSEEQLLILDDIEHIRWCRYHYFNNWSYGKEKNKQLKTHPMLVPLSELAYEDILKDRDTWENALVLMKL